MRITETENEKQIDHGMKSRRNSTVTWNDRNKGIFHGEAKTEYSVTGTFNTHQIECSKLHLVVN